MANSSSANSSADGQRSADPRSDGQRSAGQRSAGQPPPGRRAHPAEPDLAAFADRRWIAGCERCRSYLLWQCEAAGFTPKIAFTTDDFVAVQALVAAGLGVTTLPGLALRAARHPGIQAVPLPGAFRHVLTMTYGEPPDPPAVARLLEVLALTVGPACSQSPPDRRAHPDLTAQDQPSGNQPVQGAASTTERRGQAVKPAR